jgi:hypothetical protein
MKPRSSLLLALTIPAALSACTMAEAKTGAAAINNASAVQCQTERNTMEEAVANYKLLERKNPANEAALVPGYLITQSKLMDLDAAGNVIAAPGSGCP